MRCKQFAVSEWALHAATCGLVTAVCGTAVCAGQTRAASPGAPAVEDNRTERTQDTLTAQGFWTGSIKPADAAQSRTRADRSPTTPAKRIVRGRTQRATAAHARSIPERTARYWTWRLVHSLRRVF